MLSPLPASLTPGNLPLPESAATSRDATGGGADFALLMQRQTDRQAALRDIDQQVAGLPRPNEPKRPADTATVPRSAADRSARQGEPEPDRPARAEAARPDSHPQPANGKPEAVRTGQEDGNAQAEPPVATSTDSDPAHAPAEAQSGHRPRRAAGASDQLPAAPRQTVDRATTDGPADGAPADARVSAGMASTTSTTQWARSRLASRAAASGLPDLTAKAAGNRPTPADQTHPASDALATGDSISISTANLSASLAPTALPAPALPWPMAQPLQPAATAASNAEDAGITVVSAAVSTGAVALPTGAQLPAAKVTTTAGMPGGMDVLAVDALRVPTAPIASSMLPDAAPTQTTDPTAAAVSLTQATVLRTTEPAASTQPMQAATANPGTAIAAAAVSTAASASMSATATTPAGPTALPAATTVAHTATTNARLPGRAVGDLTTRGRDTDPRATTRSAAQAADTAVAGAPTPATDDSMHGAAVAAAAGTATAQAIDIPLQPTMQTALPDASPATLPASLPAALPVVNPAALQTVNPAALPAVNPTALPAVNPAALQTVNPAAIPAALPGGQPAALAVRPASTESAAASVDLRPRTVTGATPSAATPAAMAPADRASVADSTRRMPTASQDTTRRDEAGPAAAGNAAAPVAAAAVPAPAATSFAGTAGADRAAQAVASHNQASGRTEAVAVADLASSFNALPLAAQGATPAVTPGSSAAAPAETRVPVPLDDPGFGAALGTQVSVMVRDGVQTARLQLNPAEMGPIAVQIALDGSAARVDFQADLASTRAVIEASLPALAGALQDAGFTLAGGGVFQHTPGRQGQGDQPANPGQARQADGNSAPGSTLPAAPGLQRTQRGLVDLVA